MIFLSVCPDTEIFPGLEEQHAFHVPHRQKVAGQAVRLPGWSPHRAPENLPSLEGRSQKPTTFSHIKEPCL